MKKTGVTPSRLIASGGWTKSPVWLQIMADCFALPIHISAVREPSCFGAALVAGIGIGVYNSYWDTSEVVPEPKKSVDPENGNFELYEEKYKMYKTIFKHQCKIK